jgi:hypothetical protein
VGPLRITPELFERITASLRDAVLQARRPAGDLQDGLRVLLQVYIPLEAEIQERPNQNWGFFWIKKTGEDPVSTAPGEHRIEVYLYLDG